MTFQIKDAAGNAVTVNPIPPVGPAAKASSLPMTLAADDPAVQSLTSILTALGATLNVLPLNSGWTSWATGAAFDARNYAAIEIQVLTVTGSATFTRSGNNVDYLTTSAKVDGVVTAASVPGFYALKGGGYLKWAGVGSILVRGYN